MASKLPERSRIPIPKSQKELSNQRIQPGFAEYDDPNIDKTGELVRGEQISRRDDDDVKDISIGIQDHDEAIMYYFNNVIQPSVHQNGQRLNVPIIYGSPEKWKAVQKDGYYRDKTGNVMAPLIMFKRNNVQKNRALTNKLDANNPLNYIITPKYFSQRNQYDNFSALNNVIPQVELYSTVVPDYVTISYSCIIYTYYVEQSNKIVEAINYAADSYWGNPERFKFLASIDGFANETQLRQGEERLVRTNFDLTLNGYLVPDALIKELNSKPKTYSRSQLVFTLETTSNLDNLTEANVSNNQ